MRVALVLFALLAAASAAPSAREDEYTQLSAQQNAMFDKLSEKYTSNVAAKQSLIKEKADLERKLADPNYESEGHGMVLGQPLVTKTYVALDNAILGALVATLFLMVGLNRLRHEWALSKKTG